MLAQNNAKSNETNSNSELTIKDITIYSLRFNYNFKTKNIAQFLNIEEDEVRDI